MNARILIFNFGFCLNYHFIVKQVISFIITTIHPCASHIDTTTLADGTYELVPESESEQREAQVNLIEVAEDPNQVSEELKTSYARSITYYFQTYAI